LFPFPIHIYKSPTDPERYITIAELLKHDILLVEDDPKQIVDLVKKTKLTFPLFYEMQFLPVFIGSFANCSPFELDFQSTS